MAKSPKIPKMPTGAKPVSKRERSAKGEAPKRVYNNESRLQKTEASRKLIIETLVALLVERKGGVVTFEEIAKLSKISLRSIYRLFKDKETLHKAMDEYLASYLGASNEQLARLDIAGFGKNAYAIFDRHEQLMMAYLYSPFGQEARRLFRRKLNQLMIAKILQKKPVEMTPEVRKKLAVIVSLVNAKMWHDIKIDFEFSGEQMGTTIEWALETLINDL